MLNTFTAVDAKKILRVLLARDPYEDELVWSDEASGIFSMRSAYKFLQHNFPNQSTNAL